MSYLTKPQLHVLDIFANAAQAANLSCADVVAYFRAMASVAEYEDYRDELTHHASCEDDVPTPMAEWLQANLEADRFECAEQVAEDVITAQWEMHVALGHLPKE